MMIIRNTSDETDIITAESPFIRMEKEPHAEGSGDVKEISPHRMNNRYDNMPAEQDIPQRTRETILLPFTGIEPMNTPASAGMNKTKRKTSLYNRIPATFRQVLHIVFCSVK
jgi:hypothetical protein